jgi:hypothetical protein
MMSANRIAASTPSSRTGMERDLGAQLRGLGDARGSRSARGAPVLGERAAGLAHEPDRRRVDGLEPAGAEEPVVHAANARTPPRPPRRRLDLVGAVGERREPRLELGRRQQDARVEHRAEEPRVRLAVAARERLAPSTARSAEEDGQQRARRGDRRRRGRRARRPRAARRRASTGASRARRSARGQLARASRARPPSRAGARQRAGLVDGPAGATRSIRSARPPYAPIGIPPPMILPSVVRSGRTPNRSCAPPRAEPEARDDLVEDQERAVGASRARGGARGSPARRDHAGVRDRRARR